MSPSEDVIGKNVSLDDGGGCDYHSSNWSIGENQGLCETDHRQNVSASVLVLRWIAIASGLVLHILVATVILRTRQLHNPRNTFWLGAISCHSATLLMGAFEILTVFYRSTNFCRIYSLLVGSPYTSLLVSLLLAIADRWIAISHPLSHRKHITVFRVLLLLTFSWLLVLAILTSPYWSGRVQLPICSVQPKVMMWITISHFVIVALIIVAQVTVYFRARQYFKFQAHHPNVSREQPTSGSSASSIKPDEYFVHLPDKTISRLELEASVTLLCGVATLCFFTLPMASVFLSIVICHATNQPNCGVIVTMIPYTRELLLWHSVVSPLLYTIRSREFSSALHRMLPRCSLSRRRAGDLHRDPHV